LRTKRASVCTFILIVFFIFTIIVPVYANDIDNSNYIQNASIGNITFDDDFDLDTISEVLGPFDSVEKTITDTGFIEKPIILKEVLLMFYLIKLSVQL